MDLIQLKKLVDDFDSLNIKEKNGSTFLEIAKCPHLENVWSNILSFYLDPNNEHKLFDLILRSLFQTAGIESKEINLKNIYVRTEYGTALGRIDIVVFADTFILGIENKVEADLYNNLDDYSNTLEDLAKPQNLPVYKIVLSKYKTNTNSGFVNITYSDLIKNIKQNLGKFTLYADSKYLIFLIDFLENIENNINSKSMAENEDVINFFHNNLDKINRLLEYHYKFISDLTLKLDAIHSNVKILTENEQTPLGGPGRFTWQGSPLIKYKITEGEISLFFQVSIKDYKIVSHYFFENEKYEYVRSILEQKEIKEVYYEYGDTPENIASNIAEQIQKIISILKEL